MSDEQPPPSLRLRPRNRDAADAPPAPATPATPAIPDVAPVDRGTEVTAVPSVASVPDPAPGRFRLKPKITPVAEDPAPSSGAPASTPVQSADQDAASVPRLKLKIGTSTTADLGVESIAAASIAPAAGVAPTVEAVIPDDRQIGEVPAAEVPSARLIIPGLIPAAEPAVEPVVKSVPPPLPPATPVAPPPAVVKPVKPKAGSAASRRLLLGVFVLLLVGGGAGTYFYLMMEEPPPPPPLVRRAVVPQVPKPAPAAPAEVPPVPAPESRGLDPLPPAPGAQKAEAAVAAKPTKAPAAPVMTPAFRLWLDGVRINGVTASAGSVPRVIINGRLVRPGDTIDSAEGIVFESVDTEKKCVMFRNRAGFLAAKPY